VRSWARRAKFVSTTGRKIAKRDGGEPGEGEVTYCSIKPRKPRRSRFKNCRWGRVKREASLPARVRVEGAGVKRSFEQRQRDENERVQDGTR